MESYVGYMPNKWQSDRYERCKKHEDALVIKGTQGRMLRSKSEAIIDRMLYKNGILFRYEEKLILKGITIYPDFVIRQPKTEADVCGILSRNRYLA